MSTIRQNISDVRSLIKQVQNDTPYTDQFLYSLLNAAAIKLQYQRYEKHKMANDFNWITFCVPLELANSHDCDCVAVGCKVLKTPYKIPRPMVAGNHMLFKVETLGDILISRKNPQTVKDDFLDDIKAGKPGWHIRSEKLLIWNNLKYKAVQVTGIWEDITEWVGKSLCDLDGNPLPPCEDVLDTSFTLEKHLHYDMYRIVLGLLRLPLSLMDDHTVDENSNIKS